MSFFPRIPAPARGLAPCLVLLAACSTPPPVVVPPGPLQLPPNLEREAHHHFGTLLGGAGPVDPARPDGVAEQEALEVEIRILFLEGHGEAGLAPLAERTRMVATPEADQPIRGATRFAVGAGYVTGAEAESTWQDLLDGSAGRSLALEPYVGPVPVGVSTVFRLQAEETIEDPDNFLGEWPQRGPVTKRLEVGLQYEDSTGAGIGLGFSDLARGERSAEAGAPPEGGRPEGEYLQYEWLVPDLKPELNGDPLLFVVPSPFETGEGRSCAIWIEARHPWSAPEGIEGDAQDGRAFEGVLAAAQRAAERARRASEPASPGDLRLRNLLSTYTALHETTDEGRWRGLLLHLSTTGGIATSGGALLAEDLAMIADGITLRDWVDSLPALPADTDLDLHQLGWHVERSAWRFLAKLSMNEGLPLWLEALCVRHGGEVGRYPSTIQQLCGQVTNIDGFRARLVSENLLFLEDSNVSARVRAFDWLQRVGLAPSGFDPLGSPQSRRSALAASFEAQSANKNR